MSQFNQSPLLTVLVGGALLASPVPAIGQTLAITQLTELQKLVEDDLTLAERKARLYQLGAGKRLPAASLDARILRARIQSKPLARQARLLPADAAIPPALPNCQAIEIGKAYASATAAAGQLNCYQFVIDKPSKIDAIIANLPATDTFVTALYRLENNGNLTPLDSDLSANNPRLLQTVSSASRIIMVVQTTQGAAGKEFVFGTFSRLGYDQYEPNDKPGNATPLQINQSVSANIDTPGVDRDYYLFKLKPGQTRATLNASTTKSQSVGISLLQATVQGGWKALSNEQALAAAVSQLNLPAPSDATLPYGLLVRISGADKAAPAGEPYTVALSDSEIKIGGWSQSNTENITRLLSRRMDRGYLEAANWIDIPVKVVTVVGDIPVSGAVVRIRYSLNAGDPNAEKELQVRTDQGGSANIRINFPACTGVPRVENDIPSYSVPTDYWDISFQIAYYSISLPYTTYGGDGVEVPGNPFIRICSETYRGRH